MKKDFSKRILVSITGSKDRHWKNKLKEIEKYKLKKVALFLECFKKNQRDKIYSALLKSKIKKIPLVHIRNDMVKEELEFLSKNFKSKYFTIHEDSFSVMEKWKGFYKNLFLEMNYDNFVSKNIDVSRIGGFCVDLAHFKAGQARNSKDFDYVKKRKNSKYFACNHLGGYSFNNKKDIHTIKSIKQFDYLKTLPKFLFGKVIAIEIENSISQQLEFKRYLGKLLCP